MSDAVHLPIFDLLQRVCRQMIVDPLLVVRGAQRVGARLSLVVFLSLCGRSLMLVAVKVSELHESSLM